MFSIGLTWLSLRQFWLNICTYYQMKFLFEEKMSQRFVVGSTVKGHKGKMPAERRGSSWRIIHPASDFHKNSQKKTLQMGHMHKMNLFLWIWKHFKDYRRYMTRCHARIGASPANPWKWRWSNIIQYSNIHCSRLLDRFCWYTEYPNI